MNNPTQEKARESESRLRNPGTRGTPTAATRYCCSVVAVAMLASQKERNSARSNFENEREEEKMYSSGGAEAESESESERNRMGDDKEEQGSSFKSWAKQTEESYQLQLALALRLSSHSASSSDHPSSSAQTLTHRFWVFTSFHNEFVLRKYMLIGVCCG